MNKIGDDILNECIFEYLEPGFKFAVLSRLSRGFRTIVYRPENNSIVNFDFTKIYDSNSLRAPSLAGGWVPGMSGSSTCSFFIDKNQQKRESVTNVDKLHFKLWNTFDVNELFGEGGIFSKISQIKIKFKIDQIFNREFSELISHLRVMETLTKIELVSPPVDFVSELFLDQKITDCYCLDEDNINCVDERLENPEGEEFLSQLECLSLQDVEIDTMTKIFNYNFFLKFKSLKEIFFNDIYSIKTNTASILSGSTPRSRSMSFDESSVVGGLYDQQSIVTLSPGPSPPSQLILDDPFQFPPRVSVDVVHDNIEKIDLYMIPFNEALNFIKINFLHNFPNLKVLKIRCLSSSKHAGLLTEVLRYQFASSGLPSLEEIEIGFLTAEFATLLIDVCEPNCLKKLSVTSRIDFSGESISEKLFDFGKRFNLSEINFRIHKNTQLLEIIELIESTPLLHSLKKIKISWNLINSIEIDSLINLRGLLKNFNKFIVSSCSVVVERDAPKRIFISTFERFYFEFCQQRVYCECEECLDERDDETGIENEEHLRRIATGEWTEEISNDSRNILHSLFYLFVIECVLYKFS
jgi:hypothetical protein